VHSGYTKRRCELARAGVLLYEMKPGAGTPAKKRDGDGAGGTGSSNSHLHAKTFAVDGQHVFVGSFNFDLRSALLNTELGLVIDSEPLARRLTSALDRFIAGSAYEVRVRSDGSSCVEWIDHTPAGDVVLDTEPGAGWGKRMWLEILEAMPIDWML
jgi:putative cardiolipin synthase